MMKKYKVTHKGISYLAAVEAGMVEKTEHGWATDKFEVFWQKYVEYLLKQRPDEVCDGCAVVNYYREKRHNNGNKNCQNREIEVHNKSPFLPTV